MIDTSALKTAIDAVVAQDAVLVSKLDELTTDVQKNLLASIAASNQQVADAIAAVQAEIDSVVTPVAPVAPVTPAPAPEPVPPSMTY